MVRSLHSASYARLLAVIVAARRQKGLTQETVATRLKKPQSYIAKIEGGERRLDILEFISLAKAMDAEPIVLFRAVLKNLGPVEGGKRG